MGKLQLHSFATLGGRSLEKDCRTVFLNRPLCGRPFETSQVMTNMRTTFMTRKYFTDRRRNRKHRPQPQKFSKLPCLT